MAKLKSVYRCEVCGNIVEVLHEGEGQLVCCDKPMVELPEKIEDPEKGEKHVPVIEKTEKGVLVKVGAVEHPMDEDHYIEFIEIIADGVIYRKHLKPRDKPEAEFCIEAENIVAREY